MAQQSSGGFDPSQSSPRCPLCNSQNDRQEGQAKVHVWQRGGQATQAPRGKPSPLEGYLPFGLGHARNKPRATYYCKLK
jgi:hypothetical protein